VIVSGQGNSMPNEYTPQFAVPQSGWWFVYQCPVSGVQVFIDPDRSNGRDGVPAGNYILSCYACQKVHEFDAAEINSINIER
jgi:hypothetical protein